MPRRVYTPSRSRGWSNGRYWETSDDNVDHPLEETDFCDDCDALTLHKDGRCQRCYTLNKKLTSKNNGKILFKDNPKQKKYTENARANKNNNR